MSEGFRSLCGVHVLECDSHNNKVVAWQYPECDRDLGAVMLARWSPHAVEKDLVRVSRFHRHWLYTATLNIATPMELVEKNEGETAPNAAPEIAARFPKVSAVAICVISDTFAPKCLQALSDALLSLYVADGNPLRLLRCYLAVFCNGEYKEEDKTVFAIADHKDEDNKDIMGTTGIKELVNTLGEEIILVYCALMMKKRIAVYAQSVSEVREVILALPRLVEHRAQGWYSQLAWPFVTSLECELDDVRHAGVFAAGFTDMEALGNNADLYDILVDMPSQTVTVSPNALEQFALTKLHKEITVFLVDGVTNAEKNLSEEQLAEGLNERTKNILDKLEQLRTGEGDQKFVTMDSIHEIGKVSPPLDRFLFAVAQAEDMTPRAQTASVEEDAEQ